MGRAHRAALSCELKALKWSRGCRTDNVRRSGVVQKVLRCLDDEHGGKQALVAVAARAFFFQKPKVD